MPPHVYIHTSRTHIQSNYGNLKAGTNLVKWCANTRDLNAVVFQNPHESTARRHFQWVKHRKNMPLNHITWHIHSQSYSHAHTYTHIVWPNKQFIHANMVLLKMPSKNMHHTNGKTKIQPQFFVLATEKSLRIKIQRQQKCCHHHKCSCFFIWFTVECWVCMRYVVFDTQLDRNENDFTTDSS